MKEKIYKKTWFKTVIVLWISVLVFVVSLLWYKLYDTWWVSEEELQLRAADEYKFEQFHLVKETLKNVEKIYGFRSPRTFNRWYGELIIPQNSCYYLVATSLFKEHPDFEKLWSAEFIMGFELESDKYNKKYPKGYFLYPESGLLSYISCIQGIGCYDERESIFKEIISKPCKD